MSLGQAFSELVGALNEDCHDVLLPPEEGCESDSQPVISISIVRNTRGYIERIAHQINGCYENGWYDACAVMVRRLLEILIIEAFEHFGVTDKVKNTNGDFLYLADLIARLLGETTWGLSRNTKTALPKLKELGDKSAHSRRFNAVRSDIDRVLPELRVTYQELIYLAKLK
jgi:hypothetical protein